MSGGECYKTKRIKKDQKVFGLYSSMALGQVEKVRSVTKRQIIIFSILIISAGLLFRFGFYPLVFRNFSKKSPVTSSSPSPSPTSLSKLLNISKIPKNSYKIVGIIDNHYLVKTSKGIKKVKIDMKNKKNINDEIRIEKL